MACDRFESEGLLYISNELEPAARQAYDAHVPSCEECREEMSEYRALRQLTDDGRLFEVETNPAVDAVIRKVCERPAALPTTMSIGFGSMVRRFALPVLFLCVGFGGGAYMVVATSGLSGTAVAVKAPAAVPAASISAAPVVAEAQPLVQPLDSAENDSVMPASRPMGNLQSDGVVPVGLNSGDE